MIKTLTSWWGKVRLDKLNTLLHFSRMPLLSPSAPPIRNIISEWCIMVCSIKVENVFELQGCPFSSKAITKEFLFMDESIFFASSSFFKRIFFSFDLIWWFTHSIFVKLVIREVYSSISALTDDEGGDPILMILINNVT